MGRRRERTKWSQVHWIQDRKSCERSQRSPGISGSPADQRKFRRNLALLAPRFAKTFAAAAENSGEQTVSADCIIEELPDGFTKIRSKNLDILFKRDFYEKKMNMDQRLSLESKIQKCQDVDPEPMSLNESEITATEDFGCSSFRTQVSFEQLDIDEIPEFRPRQGTLDSINESGYSSSFQESFCYDQYTYQAPPCPYPPPHHQPPPPYLPPTPMPMSVPPPQHVSQFYLYSPISNTLIPCEEVLVAQPFQSPEGPVYHNHTKAYVAYPVQGPDGRGYITQPFAPPPNYGSGSEKQAEDSNDIGLRHQALDGNFNEVKTLGEDLMMNPGQKVGVNDCASAAVSVYIPGLPPPSEKKLKKRRKKKPKSKANQITAKSSNSSSESETKEPMATMEFESNAFDNEFFDYVTEPVNEINLTDDLANSLLNPPTEEDELETSAIAREIMNLVDTEEEQFEAEAASEDIGEHVPGNECVVQGRSSNQDILMEKKENETQPTENGKSNTKVQNKFKSKKKKRNQFKANKVDCNSYDATIAANAEISGMLIEDKTSPNREVFVSLVEDEETVNDPDEVMIEKKDHCQDDDVQVDSVPPPPTGPEALAEEESLKESNDPNDDKVEPTKEENPDGQDVKVRKRRRRGGKVSKEKKPPLQRVLVVDDQVDIRYCPTSLPSDPHHDGGPGSPINAFTEDFLVIKELGIGMLRGMMNLGRPFQGYYVPPERNDFSALVMENGDEII